MGARRWIETDRQAVLGDIRRLGTTRAAEYQLELIAECISSGDGRWVGITEEAMFEAVVALEDERDHEAENAIVNAINWARGMAELPPLAPADVADEAVVSLRREARTAEDAALVVACDWYLRPVGDEN